MTARERAESLVPEEWAGSTEERIREIEAAIRAAEAAAYERAAEEVETSLELCGDGCGGVDLKDTRELAAKMIRDLLGSPA